MNSEIRKYKSHLSWLLHHLIRQKILVVLVGITIVFVLFTRTLIPLVLGDIVDKTIQISAITEILPFIFLALSLYLVNISMDYASMMLGHYLGLKIEKDMRTEFFDVIQSKPLKYHDSARTGDLQALATYDLRIINTMVSHGAFYIYPFILVAITAIILFDLLDFKLALLFIPFLIFYLYFILHYRKALSPFVTARMEKHSNIAITLQDDISGTSVIKTFTAEKRERKKFLSAVRAFRDNWIGENRVQSNFYPLLILYLAISIMFMLSCFFVYYNTLSIGVLISVNLLLTTLIDPTNTIFWATNDMMSGFAACKRLFKALSKGESESNSATLNRWPENFQGHIEFKNVSFGYEDESNNVTPVFENLTFSIEPNQTVALVGPTGCGKTTLAKLILSLYKPSSGVILLDGINIQNYPLEVLRKHVGYVEQDIYLFPRSIRENISFGKPEADNDEIFEAARLAQVDDFAEKFPEKYETIVGERGTRLSGGERQRIAIARALLTKPAIVILDDSVSAVDSETEEKIGKAIENVLKGRTTIIITHRLNAIRNSDKVLVLKNGRIVAEGNHNDLITRSQDYRRIFGKHLDLPPIKREEGVI
jgi:ATP-binding cassette subfamily B protein